VLLTLGFFFFLLLLEAVCLGVGSGFDCGAAVSVKDLNDVTAHCWYRRWLDRNSRSGVEDGVTAPDAVGLLARSLPRPVRIEREASDANYRGLALH
jgi:hypothetical protein